MDGAQMGLIASNLTNAVALDFHYDEGKIYWSDVTSSISKIQRMNLDGSNMTVISTNINDLKYYAGSGFLHSHCNKYPFILSVI
jgi:hypothetical protein